MTGMLLKLAAGKNADLRDPDVRASVGRMAGAVGVACNVLLSAAKLAAGLAAGAVSVVADALNNLSDAGGSLIALLGFRMARRPADENHPFGHARAEYIAGLGVAVMVLILGANLARSSFGRILNPQPLDASALTFAVLAASVAVKAWLNLFFRRTGRLIDSGALTAAAADSRNDVIATAAVLASCLVQRIWNVQADGWAGLAVAAFILWSGFGMLKEAVTPILGRRPDDSLVGQLSGVILSREQVLGMHDLLVHDYGPGHCYASVHVELSAQLDAVAAHDVADGIEREALQRLHVHLVVHSDPVAGEQENG